MLLFAVAASGPNPDDKVSDLFENSTHMHFYDADEDKYIEVVERNGMDDVQFAQVVASKEAEAIVCGPLKQGPYDIIAGDENSITRYNGVGLTSIDALKKSLNYQLDIIRDPLDGIGCLGHTLHE